MTTAMDNESAVLEKKTRVNRSRYRKYTAAAPQIIMDNNNNDPQYARRNNANRDRRALNRPFSRFSVVPRLSEMERTAGALFQIP